jgi:hypothetical protein
MERAYQEALDRYNAHGDLLAPLNGEDPAEPVPALEPIRIAAAPSPAAVTVQDPPHEHPPALV